MTLDKRRLARDAMTRAYRVRRDTGLALDVPLCVYDLAEGMGVDVWFKAIPRLEGMYVKSPGPSIVVSSLRPAGRQVYTGGHELGHHIYGHGSRIDEVQEGQRQEDSEEEFLAECFSGFLLMPRPAVARGFELRGCTPGAATAEQVYEVAAWLGVGYDALVTHMCLNLRLLKRSRAAALRKVTPKTIKARLLGADCPEHLVVASDSWLERAIDIQVGDAIICTSGVVSEGRCVTPDKSFLFGTVLRGNTPGQGRVLSPDSGWASFIRVSRLGFAGRARFRHLEETEDEDDPVVR
jgi:Zn-dependent peptidase ImmA (M78 family)